MKHQYIGKFKSGTPIDIANVEAAIADIENT